MAGEKNTYLGELLVLASLLHDIGKIKHRAGHGKRHEELSSDLVREYEELFRRLGIDVDQLADLVLCHHYQRSGIQKCNQYDELLNYLIKADHVSAPERHVSSRKGKPVSKKLVSPLWVKYYYEKYGSAYVEDKAREIIRSSRICYEPVPLTVISRYGVEPDTARKVYRASNCSDCEDKILQARYSDIYGGIHEFFERLSELASKNMISRETLVDTLINYIRYALLLVPDDLYWTSIPDTSLSVHSIITAALAYAMYKGKDDKIVLGILDLSGIQSFISSISRTKGALRQIRGRSLLLQLVMRASSRYLIEKLGLSPASLILLRGDNALFILPNTREVREKFEEALRDINMQLYEIFHGDVYVSGALSDPFTPDYTMPWSREHGEKGFSKAIAELGERLARDKYRKLARISDYMADKQKKYLEETSRPAQCDLCAKTIAEEELISTERKPYLKKLSENGAEKICTACLLSYLAGLTAVNLEFIVEIEDHDIAETLFEGINGRVGSDFRLYGETDEYKYAAIPLPWLGRTYVLLSIKPGNIVDDPSKAWDALRKILAVLILKTLIGKHYAEIASDRQRQEKVITINILRINDPPSMLPPRGGLPGPEIIEGIRVRYGFSNIFANFTNKATEELDDLAKTSSDRYTYLSWIKMDIDRMGLTGLYLSGSVGRYITLAELVNFFTNMLGHRILDYDAAHPEGYHTRLSDNTIVVFSGGDDTFVISRFVEGLYYLRHYGSWFRDFFGEISGSPVLTLSAGYFLSEADFPSYLSYNRSLEKLETAKQEGRNLVDVSFLEIIPPIDADVKSLPPMRSMEWGVFEVLVDMSTDEDVVGWITSNKVLSFKIMSILRRIAEESYAVLALQGRGKNHDLSRHYRYLAENIIGFSYIYARIRGTTRARKYEDIIYKVSGKLSRLPALPREYVDLLSNNDLKEIHGSASAFYRLFQLVYLRLRENL